MSGVPGPTALEACVSPVALTDVHYEGEGGRAACVVAATWSEPASLEERVVQVPAARPYRPGAFYERELPCLLRVLAVVTTSIRAVVVDGYVELDERGTPGLGARLHAALGGAVAVVGVAKTPFRGSTFARRVMRGRSRAPLFVTSRGIDPAVAALLVHQMHGFHRVPTLLARVDRLARGLVRPAPTRS